MDYNAPGYQSTQPDIKNPYNQHDVRCMESDAPGHHATQLVINYIALLYCKKLMYGRSGFF